MIQRRHGRPLSECCQAKLRQKYVGNWDEFECTKCSTNTDADGKLYRYTTTSIHGQPTAATVTPRTNSPLEP